MLSLGVETWSKSLHKVGFTRKARVLLGLQGQTPRFPASGPWTPQNFLLRFPKTLWAFPFGPNNVFSYPNISGKHPEPLPVNSGTLSKTKHYYPIYQSLSSGHSGVPRHVRDLIPDSEQHSVTNIHNSHSTISSMNVKHADPTGSRTM